MAMTVAEANAAQEVVRWAVQQADHNKPNAEVTQALAYLADRSHKVLGAGVTGVGVTYWHEFG